LSRGILILIKLKYGRERGV